MPVKFGIGSTPKARTFSCVETRAGWPKTSMLRCAKSCRSRAERASGTQGVITQSVGGSYTIATYQGLARVAEKDLDAIGLQKPQAQEAAKTISTDGEVSEEDVWNQLRQCYDPEIPVNIVDLGLVYDCRLIKKEDGGTRVEVKMTLTAPGCGMGPAIAHDAQSKILSVDGVDEADVQLVWDPPWNQNMISEAGRMKLGMI